MINLLTNFTWMDLIDILLITFVVYQLYMLFNKTKGFRIMIGLFGLSFVYILAKAWGLFLSTWLFQIFWQALIILIIIVFQPEIRDVLSRLNLLNFIQGKKALSAKVSGIETISHAAFHMAKEKTGAIIVFKQKDDLRSLIKSGIQLDGEISEPILMSIFQKQSPVHDGAIIIEEGRIKKVGGYLPLTEREDLPNHYGSRHRAALGLSEKSDAFIIVVSEERGDVSFVHYGNTSKSQDENSLATLIQGHFIQSQEKRHFLLGSVFSRVFIQNWHKKLATFFLVFLLWAMLAGQQNYSQELIVPIEFEKIPVNMELVSPPKNVRISIKGTRKLVSDLKPEEIHIVLDVALAQWGRRTYYISDENVKLPAGTELVGIDPPVLRLDFKNIPPSEKQ